MLSPSAASRWLECTPSPRFEERFPDNAGEAAAEGTLAHEIGEAFITTPELALHTDVLYNDPRYSDNKFLCEDLLEHSCNYAAFVLERFEDARRHTPDAILKVEQRIDLTAYAPECFGTGDAVIIADGVLEIIDYKYGKGVRVSAEHNKQMMMYGLGSLYDVSDFYDIDTVRMTIYQPRLDNISSFEIGAEELQEWGEKVLKPTAEKAFAGKGDFKAGNHCKFCRGRNQCKALADYNLELAKYEFQESCTLTQDDIADILNRADMFKSWLSGIEDYALQQALSGVRYPGHKLVEGRSVRMYKDQDAVAKRLVESGVPEALIYERKLLGITAMEKTITKKKFGEVLSDLVIKPAGKPTLVPASDKRAEYNSAAQDFSDLD
ncbi:MAG: DUF2800 domain-containing protein [Tannerellaceae bacterium]